MIELLDISYRFGEQDILKNINYTFHQGKTYIITGEASSGKSVLMKIIGGITKPTSGRVLINGVDFYSGNQQRYQKSKIGFIFQDGVLLSNLTICENLLLPVKYLYPKHNIEEIMSKIQQLFDRFHINLNILNKRPSEVSYSTRKLVNIIRAELIDPEYHLINRPLFNTDFVDSKRVMSFLQDIKKLNKTMVITTNHKVLIKMLADEVIILNNGTVLSYGNGCEFFTLDDPFVVNYIVNNLG